MKTVPKFCFRYMSLKNKACIFNYLYLSFSLFRRHKPGRDSGADVLADPHGDPAPPGHETLPAVPHGDPPSSAQHEPLPQLQHGESWCTQTQTNTHILRPFKSPSAIRKTHKRDFFLHQNLGNFCVFTSRTLSHAALMLLLPCGIYFSNALTSFKVCL